MKTQAALIPIAYLLLAACASTPEGQSVDRAQAADIGSTAVALAAGAVEGNPVLESDPYFAVAKLTIGPYVDSRPCRERVKLSRSINSLTWGVVGNNLLVAAGTSVAPLAGAAAGVAYWLTHAGDCGPTPRQSEQAALWLSVHPEVEIISSVWGDDMVIGQALVGGDLRVYALQFAGDDLIAAEIGRE